MFKLFFNRGLRNKVEYLKLENVNLTLKNTNLSNDLSKEINKSSMLEKSLNNILNELTEVNKKLNEYKTANILLEKDLLKKIQLLEIKEEQRRKVAGKVGGLEKENNKLKEEKKEYKAKIKELEKELDKRYIIKKIPSGRTPKGQKMSIKSSSVQSKIIKEIKED